MYVRSYCQYVEHQVAMQMIFHTHSHTHTLSHTRTLTLTLTLTHTHTHTQSHTHTHTHTHAHSWGTVPNEDKPRYGPDSRDGVEPMTSDLEVEDLGASSEETTPTSDNVQNLSILDVS